MEAELTRNRNTPAPATVRMRVELEVVATIQTCKLSDSPEFIVDMAVLSAKDASYVADPAKGITSVKVAEITPVSLEMKIT